MKLNFTTLDVFTTERFKGNPLAIVRVPKGVDLSYEKRVSIAREFNLSETIFVYEESDNVIEEVRASIFITTQELPFAGHPTVGLSAYLLSNQCPTIKTNEKNLTLDIPAGKVQAKFEKGKAVLSIPHNVCVHSFKISASILRHACPGVTRDSPVVSIVAGMTFALIELATLEELSQVRPIGKRVDCPIKQATEEEEAWLTNKFIMLYFYVVESQSLDNFSVRTRMVMDNEEDPATGSAASALSSFLTLQHKASECTFSITQGIEMGRESDISVKVQQSNGQVTNVELAGTAVRVMEGQLEIDD